MPRSRASNFSQQQRCYCCSCDCVCDWSSCATIFVKLLLNLQKKPSDWAYFSEQYCKTLLETPFRSLYVTYLHLTRAMASSSLKHFDFTSKQSLTNVNAVMKHSVLSPDLLKLSKLPDAMKRDQKKVRGEIRLLTPLGKDYRTMV